LKYSLDEIYNEALSHYKSKHLQSKEHESCIFLGVKITKDYATEEIKIFDPSKSNNYYIELDIKLYELFFKEGWTRAVLKITLEKYISKLERIKESINNEVNNNASQKRLNFFRESREQILKKYYKLTLKLNTNDYTKNY
tara:strand:+ start:3619 stop:4038 length:420 start_codon:yes stop_codon:yes gene_type:complete